MTNQDKQALIDNACTIHTKLIIHNDDSSTTTITQDDYVVSWDYEDYRYVPNQGIIGQFVERVVSCTLKQISSSFILENKIFELFYGIERNSDNVLTWYSLGNFIINEVSNDNVKETIQIKAVDYTKYFEKKFEDRLTYPTTALALAQDVCNQCGVILGSSTFTNSDFVIPNNQFTENQTCRDVMKAIGMLAYSWVRIDWDNKVYLDFVPNSSISQYDVITNDNYYGLIKQEEQYGAINKVVIGMKDVDGENVSITQSGTSGDNELDIWDNPITYTQDLRQTAITSGNVLFGFSYMPIDITTTGHPWLKGNEKIELVQMDGSSIYTYAFDRTISYAGHIKTKLVSSAMSKTNTQYTYEGKISTSIRNTQIIVDKANQRIDAVVSEVEDLTDSVKPLAESSTNPLELENSGGKTLVNYELEGNIHQETTSGKNKFNSIDYPVSETINGVTITNNGDGSFTLNGTCNTTNTSFILGLNNVVSSLASQSNLTHTAYYISGSATKGSTSTARCVIRLNYNTGSATMIPLNELTSSNPIISKVLNQTSRTDGWSWVINLAQGDTFNNLTIKYMLETGSTATEYEPYTYGASPNPNYEQPIDVIDGYNLIDTTLISRTYHGCTWTGHTDGLLTIQGTLTSTGTNGQTVNKKLKKGYHRFLIKEPIDKTLKIHIMKDDGTNKYTGITPGATSVSFLLETTAHSYQIYMDGLTSGEEINISCYPMLSEGSDIKEYLPFNNIGLKNIGKNLFKFDSNMVLTRTSGGIATTIIDENTITFNGTATSGNRWLNSNDTGQIIIEAGTYIVSHNHEGTMRVQFVVDGIGNVYSDTTTGQVVLNAKSRIANIQVYTESGRAYNEEIKIQIEEGSVATDYQPFQEIITPIDLQQNFIGEIENTKDLLRYENGHVYLDKKIGKKVIDGTENWRNDAGTVGNDYRHNIKFQDIQLPNSVARRNGLSNYFHSDYITRDGIWEKGEFYCNGEWIVIWDINQNYNLTDFKTWLSSHNTEVYYELAEPYTVDLGEYILPTLEGDSTISLLATLQGNMYCRYIRKTDFNDTYQTIDGMRDYYNKVETDARITIETDNINESVSEIRSLVDENGNNIMSLQQSVTEQITSTQAQFSVINSTLENGVEKVNTGLVLIDINGLRVQKGDSKVLTLMANNTFALVKTPYDSANPEYLAFFGYDETEQTSKSQMDNLTITNYLTAGYHRQEKMTNVENARGEYENRTGWFYAGGV